MWRTTMVTLLAIGCAPELEGADQVHDVNYTFASSADQQLNNVTYPAADVLVEGLLAEGATGCGFGLVEDGTVFYVQGIGTWPLGGVAPIGSVSKTLTALGVVRLMEETTLQSTDSIQEHLPDAPWDVTIGELLDHTTGLDSWTFDDPVPNIAGYPGSHPMQEPRYAFEQYAPHETQTEAVGAIDPPSGLPSGSYSNVGYSVLGALIDEVVTSGAYGVDGYEQWIWREVARGTNLTNGTPTAALFHTWRVGDIPELVAGYTDGVLAPAWDVTGVGEGWEGPAGGWSMTAGGLARIVAAIQRGDIVADDTWLEPTSAVHVYGGEPREEYGWAVVVEMVPGAVKYSHPGENLAYTAEWAWYDYHDGDDFGVAMICNGNVGKDNMDYVIGRLAFAYRSGSLVPEFPIGIHAAVGGTGAVIGRRFAVDVSASTTDLPGIGAPGALLSRALTVVVGSGRSGLELTLVGASGAVWRGVDFSKDPYVRTGTPVNLTLPVDGGALSLEGASFAGTFADRGASLVDIEVAGDLDTRTIPAAWLLGRDACLEAAQAGRPCEPCGDGVRACVPLGLVGWTAR